MTAAEKSRQRLLAILYDQLNELAERDDVDRVRTLDGLLGDDNEQYCLDLLKES